MSGLDGMDGSIYLRSLVLKEHRQSDAKNGVQRTPGRFDIVFDDMMTIYQKLGLYCDKHAALSELKIRKIWIL